MNSEKVKAKFSNSAKLDNSTIRTFLHWMGTPYQHSTPFRSCQASQHVKFLHRFAQASWFLISKLRLNP